MDRMTSSPRSLTVSRRRLLRWVALSAGMTLAAACSTPASSPAPAKPASQSTAAPSQPTQTPAKPAQVATQARETAAKPATKPGAAAKPAGQPKRGGRLVWGRPYDIRHFDSADLSPTLEPMLLQLYSPLIRLDKDMKPQPEIAESWEFSSDFKRMQIKLRKGATFHNGKEVSADDVIATIQRDNDEKTAASVRPQTLRFKEPRAVDRHTVELSFDAPMANVFDALDFMFIYDKDNHADIKNKPNGAGPFKLAEWSPGDKVRFTRHEGYYKSGMPYLDEIEIKILPDMEALLVSLQTGNVDLANPLRPRDRRRMESVRGLQIVEGAPGTFVYTVGTNVSRAPFTDKRLRQAIAYAVDRQRFVDNYMAGLGQPWNLPWPANSPAYDAELNRTYTRDVERAKQLLREAGHPNGFETTITTPSNQAGSPELAEQVQADLAVVGIRAQIEQLEESVWRPRSFDGDINLATFFSARSNKHPASLFQQTLPYRDKGISHYTSDEYRRLIEQAGVTFDVAEARRVYDQLNRTIVDEAFVIPVAPNVTLWAVRDHVLGFATNVTDWGVMEAVWLDK